MVVYMIKKRKPVGIERIKYEGKKGIPFIEAKGSSIKRNVGSWRVFKPIIDLTKCIKCRQCWLSCPDVAIYLDKKDRPHVDYNVCKGCLVCSKVCPVKCIKMVRNNE